MRVRMAVKVSGTRDGADWPDIGDTIDVSDEEAEFLTMTGLAVADTETVEKPSGPLTTKTKTTR